MTTAEAAIVARARACVGACFRLHGRDRALGLDCVGLVADAYRLSDAPTGYAMRGGDEVAIRALIEGFGFVREGDAPADLLLLEAGGFQFHLAVATDRGFVHADAGLRRVVEVPGPPRWPVLARRRPPSLQE